MEFGFGYFDCFLLIACFFVGLGKAEGYGTTIPTEGFVGAIGDASKGFFELFDGFGFVASDEPWHIEKHIAFQTIGERVVTVGG